MVSIMTRGRKVEKKLTESDVSRMIPAHGEIPHHAPQVIDSDIPPGPFRFTRAVQAPDLLHLTTESFSEDLLVPIPEIASSSGENDEVRIKRAAVLELQSGLSELLDDGVAFESDLSVDDQLTSSDVCEKDLCQNDFGNLELGQSRLTEVISSGAVERK